MSQAERLADPVTDPQLESAKTKVLHGTDSQQQGMETEHNSHAPQIRPHPVIGEAQLGRLGGPTGTVI